MTLPDSPLIRTGILLTGAWFTAVVALFVARWRMRRRAVRVQATSSVVVTGYLLLIGLTYALILIVGAKAGLMAFRTVGGAVEALLAAVWFAVLQVPCGLLVRRAMSLQFAAAPGIYECCLVAATISLVVFGSIGVGSLVLGLMA